MEATNRKSWPMEAAKVERVQMQNGVILDHDASYWKDFITDGVLDREKLSAEGYTESQHDWLEQEMAALGWVTAADATPTAPLEETVEEPVEEAPEVHEE